jgi:hypothetical protein
MRCPATYNGPFNWLRTAERFANHFRDESGVAVRRAAENGNGALVVPINSGE